ncbi:hypothetical protein P4S73_02540 [Paraglaciecola sp. Hal342]
MQKRIECKTELEEEFLKLPIGDYNYRCLNTTSLTTERLDSYWGEDGAEQAGQSTMYGLFSGGLIVENQKSLSKH